MVFDLLSEQRDCCTAICLGLTCAPLYTLLKAVYPRPIKVCEYCIPLMADFFDSDEYRGSCYQDCPAWLSRKIYGDEVNSNAEWRLWTRYHDYMMMQVQGEVIGQWVAHLPWPFGMGERWYAEVCRVKEGECDNWAPGLWRRWKRTFIAREMRDRDRECLMWEAWADWVVIMEGLSA